MNRRKCIHHWRIDDQDIGTCQKCGEVKNFGQLQVREGWKSRIGLVAKGSTPPLPSGETASEWALATIYDLEELLK